MCAHIPHNGKSTPLSRPGSNQRPEDGSAAAPRKMLGPNGRAQGNGRERGTRTNDVDSIVCGPEKRWESLLEAGGEGRQMRYWGQELWALGRNTLDDGAPTKETFRPGTTSSAGTSGITGGGDMDEVSIVMESWFKVG